MQYPAPLARVRAGRIVRFIDGSDQRFIALGKTLRSWQIKLTLLNEQEIGQLEAFSKRKTGNIRSSTSRIRSAERPFPIAVSALPR